MQAISKARGLLISAVLMVACAAALTAACVPQRTSVEVDGSSTVFPITQRAAEGFRETAEGQGIEIPLGVSGTGGGFKRFTVGETDISNASRPITESEREDARINGVEFIELAVAYDGIAVVTHPNSEFVSCLTVQQLRQIWEQGSTVNNWNQIEGAEFPDSSLNGKLYGPDRDSGTFDYFVEEIIEVEGEGRPRSDYQSSANDNILVQGVESSPGTLGYFGLSYYLEEQDSLRLIAVDNGDGCIEPNTETVASGQYAPLSRPLFIYVNTQSLQRPEVRNFVKYYLQNAATLSAEVGYVPLTGSEYAAEILELDSAIN